MMTGWQKWPVLALAALCFGCQGPSAPAVSDGKPIKLNVGVVDTTRILPEMSSYQSLRSDMMRDRTDFLESLPDASKLNKDLMQKLQAESDRRESGWRKKTMEIIADAVKQISQKTGEVAGQKHIDIVVVNTPFNSSIYYYSGQDITLDVMIGLNR